VYSTKSLHSHAGAWERGCAGDQVVGWEIVKAYGGEVKVLSFFDDCSTTAIVEKIKEQK
jgi:bifunctional ADP-heptose synthase (sugar kinase/adenylyltransferase)